MAGAPGAATGAACQATLCGACTGGGEPPPVAGLPLAQPTGMARPSAEYLALGGERRTPRPPPRDPSKTQNNVVMTMRL